MAIGVLLFVGIVAASADREPPVAQALSPTFGWLDSAVVVDNNSVLLTGWAATSDYPTYALGVRARVGSTYYFPAANYRLAYDYRPDVGAAYPGYGDFHGFSFKIPIPNGTHTICVEAQNSGVYNNLSGCRTVTMNGSSVVGRHTGRLWSHTEPSLRTVTYRRSNINGWGSDIDQGANRWDASTPGIEIARDDLFFDVDIITSDISAFVGTTTRATVRFSGSASCNDLSDACNNFPLSGGVFTRNFLYLNTGNPGVVAGGALRSTVAHEMGHALGLMHPSNPGLPTVMAPLGNPWRRTQPQAWDHGSIDIAYPN